MEISTEMVIPAIAKLKIHKAAGQSVVSQLLKTSTVTGTKSFAELSNTMTINFDWKDTSMTNIYKGKGDGE